MDWQSLLNQIKTRHEVLHAIQDEIGAPYADRAARNQALYNAITDAIDGQVEKINREKDAIIQECRDYILKTVNMRKAMGERHSVDSTSVNHIEIQKPFLQTLQRLKQEHRTVEATYKERLVTVKKLHDTLAIYTPYLEDSFLNITIPDPNQQVVDVTASYVSAVTTELARCTEEYKARLEQCQRIANEIVNLWAQLGSEASKSSLSTSTSSSSSATSCSSQFDPQSDFDRVILENHNKAPEKIGLKQATLNQLAAKRDELLEEKQRRQSKINELRAAIEPMWQKLGKDKKECETFLRRNRGFSDRVIAAFEKELAHLTELKRENMHVFVEAARANLQHLWDELYFSEEQMAEFSPAFTDIFTDASLAAHEYEVKRLEDLMESRQNALALVKKHVDLVAEKQHLEEASKDPSRLTQRGAQAAGRLLQEEKIRKRLNKELPKLEQDLVTVLQSWEDENGEDFLVYGERYLDVLERLSKVEKVPSARNRLDRATPATPSKGQAIGRAGSRAPPSRPPSVARSLPPAARTEPKVTSSTYTNPQSPSKARRPLGTLSSQAASVRSVPESPSPTKAISLEHSHLKMRPPPVPKLAVETSPIGRSQQHSVFAMPPPRLQPPSPTRSATFNQSAGSPMMTTFMSLSNIHPNHRDFSNGSNNAPSVASMTSENWETYDEGSEPEEEFDTPRAMRARPVSYAHNRPYSPSPKRRSGSMSSTASGKARLYIQQQSQRGQDLIAELMEEVQEVDDEWGEEGF